MIAWIFTPAGRGSTSRLLALVLGASVLVHALAASDIATTSAPEARATGDAPIPLEFPRDDGPHQAPIEWWYYTGHLFTDGGDRYGFEFVVFKGERGELVGFAAHFAVTDNAQGSFHYAERFAPGAGFSMDEAGAGFDLSVGEWRMSGAHGDDRLFASLDGYAISLTTESLKPPALHDGDGYIDYGSGGASYYYSRTRLTVSGTLFVRDDALDVRGDAWMDHQWGDFQTFAEGGWDWFAVQLDDGWDLMLYVVRAPDGSAAIVDGSLIDPAGKLTVLDQSDFSASSTGDWTSPTTEISYPSGWVIDAPGESLSLTLTPTLRDQELDTRASTGQIYWEGEVEVEGSRDGRSVGGLGYVELTGYAD